MHLRKKTILIVGLSFLLLTALVVSSSIFFVLGGFKELEKKMIHLNVSRGKNEVYSRIDSLNWITGDWSAWDDTFKFIQNGNEEYIKSNMTPEALVNLRLNFMVFYNKDQARPVLSYCIDLETEKKTEFPAKLLKTLGNIHKFHEFPNPHSEHSGIIMDSGIPVMISARPIVKSDYSEPIMGTLIFGSYLNREAVKRLSEIIHLNMEIAPIDDENIPKDFNPARTALLIGKKVEIYSQVINNGEIAGYTLISDIHDSPVLILKVTTSRNIYKHGKNTFLYFTISLVSISFLIIVILILFLNNEVIRPLHSLSNKFKEISKTGDLHKRLEYDSDDEIGELSNDINSLLADLEKAQKQKNRGK